MLHPMLGRSCTSLSGPIVCVFLDCDSRGSQHSASMIFLVNDAPVWLTVWLTARTFSMPCTRYFRTILVAKSPINRNTWACFLAKQTAAAQLQTRFQDRQFLSLLLAQLQMLSSLTSTESQACLSSVAWDDALAWLGLGWIAEVC